MYYLDEDEGFAAMSLFLRNFAERAGDDLLTLLADIKMDKDGRPFDLAAWSDWIECVKAVKEAPDGNFPLA